MIKKGFLFLIVVALMIVIGTTSTLAQARLDQAMDAVNDVVGDDERTEMAKIWLEERRKRLAGGNESAAPASAETAATVPPTATRLEG